MTLRHPRRGTPSMTVASLLFPVSTADDEHGGTSLVARCGGAPPHGPVGKATTRARRRATLRALVPSGQRTWGAEEEVGNWVALPGAAGSPVMEDSRSRFASAPPSPGPSSSPAPQIRAHARHVRTSSLQRFRHQMQRVEVGARRRWRRRREEPREQLLRTTVNIEAMANQKRQWYHIHAKYFQVEYTKDKLQECIQEDDDTLPLKNAYGTVSCSARFMLEPTGGPPSRRTGRGFAITPTSARVTCAFHFKREDQRHLSLTVHRL